MQPIKALIFDMDGTLVDSKDDLAAAVNHALRMLGRHPLPHEQIHRYIGNGARVLLASALEGQQAPATDPTGELAQRVNEAMPHFVEYYQEHYLSRTHLFPGVSEALAEWGRRGKLMAVATNKDSRLTHNILSALGVAHHFKLIVGPGDVTCRKPHRESIDHILKVVGVPHAEAAMVGDSSVDLATGSNAGIRTYGVSYGHGGREALQAAGAVAVVDDLRDLLSLIL
ncbi:MAG: HAD family hydrolase [Symbiobacteriia bacterium]